MMLKVRISFVLGIGTNKTQTGYPGGFTSSSAEAGQSAALHVCIVSTAFAMKDAKHSTKMRHQTIQMILHTRDPCGCKACEETFLSDVFPLWTSGSCGNLSLSRVPSKGWID